MASPTAEIIARRIVQTASADVVSTEPAALRDDPDGVHQHRTRVRRMRAVLPALKRFVEPADVEPLRAALKEWGGQLGEVRDAEVRADLAEKRLAALGVDDADIRRRLVDDERAGHERLHARLRELAETPRAKAREQLLRESGLELRLHKPEADGQKTFARVLKREVRAIRRASERTDGSLDNDHELRKAGRRLRYVAEAIDRADPDLFGKTARRLGEAGEKIHDALGSHRDDLLLAERLEHVRASAAHAGESLAPYDALIAAARTRADEHRAQLPAALKKVKKTARRL